MNNLFKQTFAFKPWKQNRDNNCPANCPLKVKGLIWIANHPFWVSQCLCCYTYQFEKGKIVNEWGNYD